MTGSQPMSENRQQEGETTIEEEDTEGFDAEIEPFGLLENYIRVEGGESFEDLVALSFTPRDGHELYLPLSPEVVPFLSRFTQVQREERYLEMFGTRQWSFGPAFVARSAMSPEPVRFPPSLSCGVTFQLQPGDTEATFEAQASLVCGFQSG
ncbi:hypothetical protein CPB85DRAFT_1264669 [Mucidula mucida]|nr:hypothetical protein CPB85DRAFT_1264669 [Mucidula mucida]